MLVASECLSSKNVLTLRTYMDDKDDAKSFIRKFGKFDYSYWYKLIGWMKEIVVGKYILFIKLKV